MSVTLDGKEGGGQILRNAFAYAALTRRPIRVINIRGARADPGLKPQHLAGIILASRMCGGRLHGASDGSLEVEFSPGEGIKSGTFESLVHTAGSITLMVQIALPIMIFAPGPSVLVATGGTDVAFSPPLDETRYALLLLLERHFGVTCQIELGSRGFYPRGGGEVRLSSMPCSGVSSINLVDQGEVTAVDLYTFATGGEPATHVENMISAASAALSEVIPNVEIRVHKEVGRRSSKQKGDGSGITIVCQTSTGCVLCASRFLPDPSVRSRQKSKEPGNGSDCGRSAAEVLLQDLADGACVDRWLCDQILIFMALAHGVSTVRIGLRETQHLNVATDLCEQLLGVSFSKKREGATMLVSCTGIGLPSPIASPASKVKSDPTEETLSLLNEPEVLHIQQPKRDRRRAKE